MVESFILQRNNISEKPKIDIIAQEPKVFSLISNFRGS